MVAAESTQASPCPKALGDETEHFWLVQRMAKSVGVDLVKASDLGELSQEDWAAMVTQCRGCAWTAGCHRWLDSRAEEVDRAPETCLNRTMMALLKETQSA
jgi:hypothetical protein